MATKKSFLCLDLGAGSVKAAEFEINHTGGLTLKKYALQRLGMEGAQDSKREQAILAAVKKLVGESGFSARKANVCGPGFQVFSKIIKLPPVDSAKARQIIQYEAQQNIPYPIEQAVWDFQILGAAASGEMEVLLVAMKVDVVEGVFRTADAAGLKLELVDAAPAALCNAFRYNYGDLEGCTLLLDIGARTSNLLIFEKGKVFARSINIGANAITQEFLAEAKIPFAKAEELKVTEGFVGLGGAYEEPESAHQAAISKIARQVMTRLHIQVNQTIQFYRGQHGGTAPVRMFLAGGASIMPYTPQFFAEMFDIAVEYFNPVRNITLDPMVDIADLAKNAHGFGELVGMALRNFAQCPVELNLIPKSIRNKQAFDRRKPYFLATVASLILTVFGIGYFFSKTTQIKREALAHLNQVMEPLKRRSEEMDKQVKLVQRAQDEIDVYTGYLRDRLFWGDTLTEMRKLLVQVEENSARPGRDVGVWIESFGAVDVPEEEEEQPIATMGQSPIPGIPLYYLQNPEMLKRYYPQLYEIFKARGLFNLPAEAEFNTPSPLKPAASTNLVTINVRFRAVSANDPNDPAANGRLAFDVAEAFKKSGLFDPNGTKLTGDLEEPQMLTTKFGTFRFGMTLKLKNEMRL